MNNTRLRGLAGLALMFGVVACNTDNITTANRNPNSPTSAPAGPLFTSATAASVNRWLGGYDFGQVEILAQQLAETTYPQEDEYINLQADRTTASFDGPYTNELEDLRQVIAKGQAANQAAVSGPSIVMQTWGFSYLTDTFGDVPYSEALSADSAKVTPAYDAQKDIYAGFFTNLKAASDAMQADAPGDPGLGAADPIYSGDVAKWVKFANSLRARYAMRLVNVDPATADAQLKAAFRDAGGVFQSNDDNAKLVWPGDGVSDNPWSVTLKTRDDRRMSRTMMSLMVPANDPRIPVFAQPVVDSSIYANGYGGMPNGLSQDSAGKWFRLASRPGAIFYSGVTSYGTFGSTSGARTPSYLMTYAELMFIKAEAAERGIGGLSAGEAAADYNAAITASMNQWGVTNAGAIAAFLAGPAVAYKGGVAGLKQIANQKWIALYGDGGQAWSEWRRTCQPAAVAAGPAAIVAFVPRRFFYSTTEASVNAENLNAAIARQGPDDFGTRIYWDTKPANAPTCQ
jgi:hypothetical protein